MHKHWYLVACATAVLVCSAANAHAATVEVAASIDRQPEQTNRYSLTVEFKIKKGWHIYDDIGDGTEIPTSVKLKLPKGVTVADDWKRPLSVELGDASFKTAYAGNFSFSRTVVVDAAAGNQEIGVIVEFQACNDSICNRPQKKILTVHIKNQKTPGGIFEEPVRISALEKSSSRFKSPAVFDLDGDGKDELFVGSLMGSINIYTNTNTKPQGDPVWVKSEPLRNDNGDIRTSNW